MWFQVGYKVASLPPAADAFCSPSEGGLGGAGLKSHLLPIIWELLTLSLGHLCLILFSKLAQEGEVVVPGLGWWAQAFPHSIWLSQESNLSCQFSRTFIRDAIISNKHIGGHLHLWERRKEASLGITPKWAKRQICSRSLLEKQGSY